MTNTTIDLDAAIRALRAAAPSSSSRKPLKVPKYTLSPSRDWKEKAGLMRAVAVLKTEAAMLRREGYILQPKALLRVAAALALANNRDSTTGEAYALDWVRRDEATNAAWWAAPPSPPTTTKERGK